MLKLIKKLFEEYGNWQDELAWKGLANLIDKEELLFSVLSNAGKGRIYTEEQRKRISERMKGNKHCVGRVSSSYQKKRASEANSGKIVSEQTKLKQAENMSRRMKGVPKTPEQKAKMSESAKLLWKKRKDESI